MKSAQAVQQAS